MKTRVMTKTRVIFETNVESCQKFMNQNSGLLLSDINPMVGDTIRVYHDTNFEIIMFVVKRYWRLTNGLSPELVCLLDWSHSRKPLLLERVK